jgi:hypothetical protein
VLRVTVCPLLKAATENELIRISNIRIFKKCYLYAIEHVVLHGSYNMQAIMLLQLFVYSVFLHSLRNQILFSTAHGSPLGSPARTNKMQNQSVGAILKKRALRPEKNKVPV